MEKTAGCFEVRIIVHKQAWKLFLKQYPNLDIEDMTSVRRAIICGRKPNVTVYVESYIYFPAGNALGYGLSFVAFRQRPDRRRKKAGKHRKSASTQVCGRRPRLRWIGYPSHLP